MRIPTHRNIAVVSALVFLQVSCNDSPSILTPPDEPGNQANDRIRIINDDDELTGRVRYLDQDVPIDAAAGSAAMASAGQARVAAPVFSLRLVAEVLPPSIDGQVLQATSIAMRGDRAAVSYNMTGAQFLGAIDIFNISKKSRPQLRSEALFNDTDINSVSIIEGNLYAAESTGDPTFPYPAGLEVLRLQADKLVLDGNQRLALTSYAGTGVLATGTTIYTTTGDNGALSIIDEHTLVVSTAIDLHDARWVDVAEGKVVVVQGTPGQISVYDEASMSLLGTYSFTGAGVAGSKSTVQVVGGKAFIAAGTGGVQILSVNTGAVVGSVPLPDPALLGLDPSAVVTNAVAVDGDLLFISNGGAGVYIAQGSEAFDATGSEEEQQITLLGQLRFDDFPSINHVAFKNDYLIIASGLGGLKIIKIVWNDGGAR